MLHSRRPSKVSISRRKQTICLVDMLSNRIINVESDRTVHNQNAIPHSFRRSSIPGEPSHDWIGVLSEKGIKKQLKSQPLKQSGSQSINKSSK